MEFQAAYGCKIGDLDVVTIRSGEEKSELTALLLKLGVSRVRRFPTAHSALKAMKVDPPNLVITSWDIDHADPGNIIRWMRDKSLGSLCFVPVLVLTRNAARRVVEEAARLGASQFLVEPLQEDVLQQRLEWLFADDRKFSLCGDFYEIEKSKQISPDVYKSRIVQRNSRRRAKILAHPDDMAASCGEVLPPATETWKI